MLLLPLRLFTAKRLRANAASKAGQLRALLSMPEPAGFPWQERDPRGDRDPGGGPAASAGTQQPHSAAAQGAVPPLGNFTFAPSLLRSARMVGWRWLKKI